MEKERKKIMKKGRKKYGENEKKCMRKCVKREKKR